MAPRRPWGALALLLVPLALVLGIWLGGHPQNLPGFVRSALVGDDESRLVDEALDIIQSDYYRRVDRERLVNRGLSGAVRSLDDRFSHYFDPRSYARFSESTSGRYAGVGVAVQEDRRGLRVVRVLPNTPAARAGMRKGDVVTGVNGRSIAGTPSDVSTALIRGEPGTTVTLLVLRRQGRRSIRLRRAAMKLRNVRARMLRWNGRKIAYVALAQFSSGAHGEVAEALRPLLRRGATGIILDLRGNGGGLLEEARLLASLFIRDGTIVSTDGRARPRQVLDATGSPLDTRTPLVVLMNRDTASASEIVAGAIQDRKRGDLVGTRSFGKGVFQEVKRLSNGGAVDITVGEYFLPSGRNLGGGGVREGQGLRPNVLVRELPREPGDEQLRAAERALSGRLS